MKNYLLNSEINQIKNINIKTAKGSFNVWTKTYGNHAIVKILLIPGGPGLTHEYLECFEYYFPQKGIEIIEYDPLGSYFSDQPTEESLWTIERFVDEVEQVRIELGLNKDNFYLLGHSFGSAVAMQYALKYQENLKGLIACNMLASFKEYNKYLKVLRSRFPQSTIELLESFENKGLFKDSNYQSLLIQELYLKYLGKLKEFPEPLFRTVTNANTKISDFMLGINPFNINGNLINWDISTELNKIYVPTLFVGAKNDTMDPAYIKWMSTQVIDGSFLFCENGSHFSMWDDQETFMAGILNFVNKIEKEN